MKIYAEENGELNAYKREVKLMKLNLKIIHEKYQRLQEECMSLHSQLIQVSEELAFYEDDDNNVVDLSEYRDDDELLLCGACKVTCVCQRG